MNIDGVNEIDNYWYLVQGKHGQPVHAFSADEMDGERIDQYHKQRKMVCNQVLIVTGISRKPRSTTDCLNLHSILCEHCRTKLNRIHKEEKRQWIEKVVF